MRAFSISTPDFKMAGIFFLARIDQKCAKFSVFIHEWFISNFWGYAVKHMTKILTAAGFLFGSASLCFGATIGTDAFNVDLSVNSTDVAFAGVSAPSGVSSGDLAPGTISDINEFALSWVDDDTFFFSLTGTFANNITIKLLGLNFTEGLLPAFIRNVVFDRTQGDISGFVGNTSIPTFGISFDTNNITISLAEIPSAAPAEQSFIDDGIAFPGQVVNLVGDGIRFHFNVTATPSTGPATVPLPASVLLLGGAMSLLAVAGRRRATA